MSRRKQLRGPDAFDLEIGDERLVVISMPVLAPDSSTLLTPAEHQVAADVLGGLSNAEIAAKRGRSVRTIANQLASIYRKLRVGSRTELAAVYAKR